MRELKIFNFDEFPVRVVQVNGEPWFVAKDVAMILGYADTKKAIELHCKYAKALNSLEGGNLPPLSKINMLHPQTVLIPESDLYRLIIKSKLPAAERFERFVMEVLLPQIRQKGFYELKTQNSRELQVWLESTFTAITVQQEKMQAQLSEINQKMVNFELCLSKGLNAIPEEVDKSRFMKSFISLLGKLYNENYLTREELHKLVALFEKQYVKKTGYNSEQKSDLKRAALILLDDFKLTPLDIAARFNQNGVETLSGKGEWTAAKVKRLLAS